MREGQGDIDGGKQRSGTVCWQFTSHCCSGYLSQFHYRCRRVPILLVLKALELCCIMQCLPLHRMSNIVYCDAPFWLALIVVLRIMNS